MQLALFYLYDSHCPWSYASFPLVEQICQHFTDIDLQAWHVAYFQGHDTVSQQTIAAVKQLSSQTFGDTYLSNLAEPKDSMMVANAMAWLNHKLPQSQLPALKALFSAHFENGIALNTSEQVTSVFESLKLSAPKKALVADKFSQDAQQIQYNIEEMQSIIGTEAIPALLLAIDEQLILLNHNLYLENPKTIVEAVTIEIEKYQHENKGD